jgi:para-aminobenzoate synthetase component 2
MSHSIAVIDNRDSFVYNLVRYLQELEATVEVFDNQVTSRELSKFDATLISPGPGSPNNAGNSIEIVKWAERESYPILGVCLGHQVIAAAFGFSVSKAPTLIHGSTSTISHLGEGIFEGIPNNFQATRYHSLAVEELSTPLRITAWSEDKIIMALQHESLPLYGLQFHPESVLTEYGYELLNNWLKSI